jgi:hypothetical protein
MATAEQVARARKDGVGGTQREILALRKELAEETARADAIEAKLLALQVRIRVLTGAARDACREADRLSRLIEGPVSTNPSTATELAEDRDRCGDRG